MKTRGKIAAEMRASFETMLPGLISQLAMHQVAHVRMVLLPEGEKQRVMMLDHTAEVLPDRGHHPDESKIDYAMLREVQS